MSDKGRSVRQSYVHNYVFLSLSSLSSSLVNQSVNLFSNVKAAQYVIVRLLVMIYVAAFTAYCDLVHNGVVYKKAYIYLVGPTYLLIY